MKTNLLIQLKLDLSEIEGEDDLVDELFKQLEKLKKEINYTLFISEDYYFSIQYDSLYSTEDCIKNLYLNDFKRIKNCCDDFISEIKEIRRHSYLRSLMS